MRLAHIGVSRIWASRAYGRLAHFPTTSQPPKAIVLQQYKKINWTLYRYLHLRSFRTLDKFIRYTHSYRIIYNVIKSLI